MAETKAAGPPIGAFGKTVGRRSLEASDSVARLRNVGKAALADFKLLGIATIGQLATKDADNLYVELCEITQQRQDPCVHDVFSATIHQAKTGEAVNWWAYTASRKSRQASGIFPGLFQKS